MNKVVLCASDIRSRARYLGDQQLPVNYMEDYSLMGFVVDHYSDAISLLLSEGYQVESADEGALITVNSPKQLLAIQAMLTRNQICCEYSDIADSLSIRPDNKSIHPEGV